ncbi:type VII secretion target [Micromonospora psammae]|uniref:type VII secretion target n=1 Tax=Micromonospora sp. CPCC 205556 TaxID=3122398 RepID=UPI002FF1AF0C
MGQTRMVADVQGDAHLGVDPLALCRHAQNVDRVAETVQQSLSAARSVGLGAEAYGHLCAALPAMLAPLQQAAERALRESASAIEESTAALRVIARRYQEADEQAADRFESTR